MKLTKFFSAVTTTMLLFATTTFAATKADVDGVNWSHNVITVTGEGVVPTDAVNYTQTKGLAAQAAKSDAYRKMAEIINGVHVEGETTVEKILTTQDTVKLRVEATIKGARVTNETFMSDGSYRVTMQVPIFGLKDSLADAVLKKNSDVEPFPEPLYEIQPSVQNYEANTPVKRRIEITQRTKIVEETFIPTPRPVKPPLSRLSVPTIDSLVAKKLQANIATVTEPVVQVSTNPAAAKPLQRKSVEEYASLAKGDYTGLIVDCRGLSLQPVMSPVILNANGTKIYGHKNLDIDKVIREGMVAYSKDPDAVERAGENPLVVKAVSLENFNSNPVLSIADSNRVLIENHATKFLKALKVVFLFD